MRVPTNRTARTAAFDGPVVDHWLERKITQTANASNMQDRSAMQEDPNLYDAVDDDDDDDDDDDNNDDDY